MADLTIALSKRAANDLAFEDAADGGDTFNNVSGDVMLLARNSGGAAVDLTFTTTKTIDGEAVDDKTVSVGAGEIALLGPFAPAVYNDAENDVAVSAGGDYADIELLAFRRGSAI